VLKLLAVVLLAALCFSGPVLAEGPIDLNGEFQFVWDLGPESDLKQYVIYKDEEVFDVVLLSNCGEEICTSPKYSNVGVAGAYAFYVRAVDLGDFYSGPSNTVMLVVENLPPGAPTGCSVRVF